MILRISKTGINEVKQKLTEIKNNIEKVNELFRLRSCDWIAKEANINLDSSINSGYPIVTDIRNSWTTITFGSVTKLINTDYNSAFVEFGTGEVGQTSPHIESKKAGYQYNVPSNSKNENGYWTFRLPNDNWITFKGYIGKAYLYKAFRKYVDTKVYEKIYKETFEEINKGLL